MTAPLDIAAILSNAGADADAPEGSQAWALAQVASTVINLIETGKQLLPRNLCLNNPRWPDSTEIPLTTTLGELRAFAAVLARIGGQP
jgi:hypothetical protein